MVVRLYQMPEECCSSGFLIKGKPKKDELVDRLASSDAKILFYTHNKSSDGASAVTYLRNKVKGAKSERVSELEGMVQSWKKDISNAEAGLEGAKLVNWHRKAWPLLYALPAFGVIACFFWLDDSPNKVLSNGISTLAAIAGVASPIISEVSRRIGKKGYKENLVLYRNGLHEAKAELRLVKHRQADQHAAAMNFLLDPDVSVISKPEVAEEIAEARRVDNYVEVKWDRVQNKIMETYRTK